MNKCFAFMLFCVCMIPKVQAQEYRWKLGVDYFFDNQEYKESDYAIPQTINGVWLNSLGGVSWNTSHTLYGGVNLLKIGGEEEAISEVEVALYYQYETPSVLFKAGFFPRKEVLSNYSDFFFRDSVNYFMPMMQGVFWQIGEDRNFVNAWMDWTGYASKDERESFYLGFSGKMSKKKFFADFQSYLFHYAGTLPATPEIGVSEQMEIMASLGLEHESANSFKGLVSAGVFAGVERDRKADETYKPIGFVARLDAELHGVGTRNRLYFGEARMRLYPSQGSGLYWGTPFLRGESYLRSDWYVRIMESKYVSAQLNCNVHFSQGKVLLQQAFTVTASISNFFDRKEGKARYPWMDFFR